MAQPTVAPYRDRRFASPSPVASPVDPMVVVLDIGVISADNASECFGSCLGTGTRGLDVVTQECREPAPEA